MKKLALALSALFAGTALLSAGALSSSAAGSGEVRGDIVILYTNDVHCGVNDVIGYDGLMLYKKEMERTHDHVLLVDAGDAIQGDTLGSMTMGEGIITLMNAVGYDVATIGNHEFDYGVDRQRELSKQLNCGYTCCNFFDKSGQPVYEPYRIIEAGGKKIAFVGAVTPSTFTSSKPAYFKNEAGEYIYSFAQGEDALYTVIQQNADSARAAGADVVILLGHLGEGEEPAEWMAPEVVAHTDNIDAVIDAHSHTVTESLIVKNKSGGDVPVTQTGTKLNNIGKMTLSADNTIKIELIDEVPEPTGDMQLPANEWMADAHRGGRYVDRNMYDKITGMKQDVSAALAVTIGHTDFDLTMHHPETGERMVRSSETNLADFTADCLRESLGADITILNGGGYRASIPAGDITVESVFKVFPFFNNPATAKVTGAQIIDYLELGARAYPAEEGAFAQVSGLSYEIDESIPSSVQTNEYGEFLGVTGERRVKNVRLADGTPLDPGKTYKLASTAYVLRDGGDAGIFTKNISELHVENAYDYQLCSDYIRDTLGGVIPEAYKNPFGQGRVVVKNGTEQPSASAADTTAPGETSATSATKPAATPDSANSGSSQSGSSTTTGSSSSPQTGAAAVSSVVLILLAASAYAVRTLCSKQGRDDS